MAKLSQIARVVIELSTASIAKASFGIPMIIGASTADVWKNADGSYSYTRIYTDIAAAVIDKLEDHFMVALKEAFSQSPRIERVMVGRLVPSEASFQADSTLADATTKKYPTGTVFEMTINGVQVQYTSVANDTAKEVGHGLFQAATSNTTLTANYTFTEDTTNTATTIVKVAPKVVAAGAPSMSSAQNVVVTPGSIKPADIDMGLTLINAESGIWYGFAILDRTPAIVQAAADWAESAETPTGSAGAGTPKQFFTASGDAAIWTTPVSASATDILSVLSRKQYLRTTLVAHKKADEEYPEVAWMAKVYTADPGSVIFGLKVLSTITPSVFTPGEQAIIWAKNGNTYEQYADNTYLINKGKTVSGEWVDIIRDRDWLIDYIQKSVASAMIRRKKIPYTNTGIQIIVNVLQGCLRYAQQIGVLAPDERNGEGETVPGFVISYPNAADVSADIKASRTLYISFVGLLAGAIQLTDIQGVLAYKYGE